MAASTTFHAHMGDDKVEVEAHLRHLEEGEGEAINYRYWSLEVHSFGTDPGSTDIVMFLAPKQMAEMADQLRLVLSQLEAHAWMATESKEVADA